MVLSGDNKLKTQAVVSNQQTPFIARKDATPETPKPHKLERGKPLRQIIVALVANLGTINTGLVFGFSAVVLPQLRSENSSIPIDPSQESWIAALSSIGTPVGSVLSGFLMDIVGRKLTLILTEVPLVVGWILTASAVNVNMIYAGRLLTGFGSGMVGAPARVYTSEICQPYLRGMLSALASVSISFGILFQTVVGTYFQWQILCMVSTSLPILAFILMLFIPETPYYLVASTKPEKAVKSLAKVRGSAYNLEIEVEHIQTFMKQNNAKRSGSTKETLAALLSPTALKPFGILATYFLIYQFSGVNAVTFYAVDIFDKSKAPIDKYTSAIILNVVRFICTAIGCILLRKCGRRPLTFVSSIGCGATMISLAGYMYYRDRCEKEGVEPALTWIPLVCIFLYTIACTLGYLIVPWVMIGEIYPQKVRGIIGGLTTCSAHMFVFCVVKTYPALTEVLNHYGTFFLYGIISLFGTSFFYVMLPETKGKTLQEIEAYFRGVPAVNTEIGNTELNVLTDAEKING